MIALTGTPGVGKSTAAAALRARGAEVVDLHAYMEENGLLGGFDAEAGSYEVDTDELDRAVLRDYGGTDAILEGHLAHFLSVDMAVVVRCRPTVLAGRLAARGYPEGKVVESVQAEALDVILCEAVGAGLKVSEVDGTGMTPEGLADAVERAVRLGGEGFEPGRVDWGEEMERWC